MEPRIDLGTYDAFFHHIAMRMRPLGTLRRLLRALSDQGAGASAIHAILEENPYIASLVLETLRGLGLKQEVGDLRTAISLAGVLPVRNMICAFEIVRGVDRGVPVLPGQAALNPFGGASETLPYALRAEEFATTQGMDYSDTAFAAGLMFDFLSRIGKGVFHASPRFEALMESLFLHGLRAGRIAVGIARARRDVKTSKYLFAACLIHDLGKGVMALLHEEPEPYIDFRDRMLQERSTRHAIHFQEIRAYGLSHEHYSALLAYHFGVFKDVDRAVLFHHEPYLIRSSGPGVYSLACMIALASNMATHFTLPEGSDSQVFETWLSPELKGFSQPRPVLLNLMHQLVRTGI